MAVLIEAFISFVCLASLIVILIEARAAGGFRRKWPIALWAGSLVALALLAVLRILVNLDGWNDARILMATVGVGNFLFGAALLVRWLFWMPPTSR